jgi:hypothetical protein
MIRPARCAGSAGDLAQVLGHRAEQEKQDDAHAEDDQEAESAWLVSG